MNGDDWSQPPEGVAEIMLPHRSTMSRWQVSPRVSPVRETVGSPVPPADAGASPSTTSGGRKGSTPSTCPGRSSCEASSAMSARRSAAYSALSSTSRGVPPGTASP